MVQDMVRVLPSGILGTGTTSFGRSPPPSVAWDRPSREYARTGEKHKSLREEVFVLVILLRFTSEMQRNDFFLLLYLVGNHSFND